MAVFREGVGVGGGGGWGQFEYICMESSANYICAKASIQVSAQ